MKKKKQPYPVVRIAGLLSFSLLTLPGVLIGLPPEVVLTRVGIGTGLVMLLALLIVRLLGIPSL